MSKQELVDSYLNGRISRRVFIRRLVGAGVSLAAAVTYAQTLSPAYVMKRAKMVHHFYYDKPPKPDKPPKEDDKPAKKATKAANATLQKVRDRLPLKNLPVKPTASPASTKTGAVRNAVKTVTKRLPKIPGA